MKTYIITFYSHFGAIRFKKEANKEEAEVLLKPVPRFLSSSCGTCAVIKTNELKFPENLDEVEQIVELTSDSSNSNAYSILYSSIDE